MKDGQHGPAQHQSWKRSSHNLKRQREEQDWQAGTGQAAPESE